MDGAEYNRAQNARRREASQFETERTGDGSVEEDSEDFNGYNGLDDTDGYGSIEARRLAGAGKKRKRYVSDTSSLQHARDSKRAQPSGSDEYNPEEDEDSEEDEHEEEYNMEDDSDEDEGEEEIEYAEEDEDDIAEQHSKSSRQRENLRSRNIQMAKQSIEKESTSVYPPPRPTRPKELQNQAAGLKVKLRIPPGPAGMKKTSSMASMTGGNATGQASEINTSRFSTPAQSDYGTVAETDDSNWEEWDEVEDEEAEAREEAAKLRRRLPAVLLTDEELASMDDEVEKVLAHRDMAGGAPSPSGDPWKAKEFYVKWARHSYIHCSWDSYATLAQLGGFKRVLNYCRKIDVEAVQRMNMGAEEREAADVRRAMQEELEKEYTQVDRIIAERSTPQAILDNQALHNQENFNGLTSNAVAHTDDPTQRNDRNASDIHMQYLCKWQGLPYSDATWETKADIIRIGGISAIDDFHKRDEASQLSRQSVDKARKLFKETGECAFTEQPGYLKAGTLRDYQLASLNWMIYNWARSVNGILADEMGLGKTVQCASLAGYLSLVQRLSSPILVVVPLSTVPNWVREFKKWIPDVNTVVYVGDAASRKVIRRFEFPPSGVDLKSLSETETEWIGQSVRSGDRAFKFDVLITTYEIALKDSSLLRNIEWSQLMVDEAHRLKNDESALYKELVTWNFRSKLLVTGTPLQNNLRELWALLAFLHPDKFPSSEEFEERHDPNDPSGVQRLHATLRPHLLRRVIKDVEKSLPPKNERILRVPMTPLQKQYYKWILTRNFKELNRGAKGAQVTLLNIISDLKKCCNHPFLFETCRENYRVPPGLAAADDVAASLVLPSGKMVLLDKLLRRLKATGHRVLIFSQMVRVLDIISEYMTARGYRYQRLDGSTPAHLRHRAMEQFNAPGSTDFAFLLSTRAGGLGINLATADTVLLFDSDWNPQNDLQAMSRAHRIGQKDIVNIYRLVTSGSVEEDILERAKRKMVLDHVVIQRMDTSGRTVLDSNQGAATAGARLFKKDELAAILKFGAADLFKEDKDNGTDDHHGASGDGLMTDEDLDAILERAEVVEQKEDASGGPSDLLSSFNVATFKADEDDAAFWSKLIPEDRRPKEEPSESIFGNSSLVQDLGIRSARLRALESPQFHESGASGGRVKTRKGGGPALKDRPGPKVDGALLRIDRWPQAVDSLGRLIASESAPRPTSFPRTLGKKDAMMFVKAVRRHCLFSKMDDIIKDTGGLVASTSPEAVNALFHGLIRGCEKVLDMQSKAPLTGSQTKKQSQVKGRQGSRSASGHTKEPEAHLDFFGIDVRAGELLAILRQMALLESKASTSIGPDGRLRLTFAERPAATGWMKSCGWTPEEDAALLLGALKYGIGSWDKIAEDKELRLWDKLIVATGKESPELHPELPKNSHLETRVLGILRQIERVTKKNAEKTYSKPQKLPKLRPRQPSAAEIEARNASVAKAESLLGDEAMTWIRKLRTLQRRGSEMETSIVVNKTRKYLTLIGERIDKATNEETAVASTTLWHFVSEYTENAMTGPQLENLYKKLKKGTSQSPIKDIH